MTHKDPDELVFKSYKTSVTPTATTKCFTPPQRRIYKLRQSIHTASEEQKRIAREHGLRPLCLTLTFADNSDFNPKHISHFISCLRAFMKRNGIALPYVWVLEKDEKLHYHLLVWVPKHIRISVRQLEGWWPHGSTWREQCRKVCNWTCYLCKAETKSDLPRGARSYGIGGLDTEGKHELHRAGLPKWLKRASPEVSILVRVKGIGWKDKISGKFYISPWCAFPVIGGYVWKKRSLFL